MESGKDTRCICIRVCDTRNNAVLRQNQAIVIKISDSLHCVFLSLVMERLSLVRAMRKPTTSPDTEAVQIRRKMLLKPINVLGLIRADAGESHAVTLVASVEEAHAPTGSTGVNAFECLLRRRQAAHRQTKFISPSDVLGWLSSSTAQGDLGLRLQAFLELCGGGCTESDTSVARKSLFLTVNRVFWAVPPRLNKTGKPISTRTSAVKHAITCIEGTDRPRAPAADGWERRARKYYLRVC